MVEVIEMVRHLFRVEKLQSVVLDTTLVVEHLRIGDYLLLIVVLIELRLNTTENSHISL
jgi:hypothetical protein